MATSYDSYYQTAMNRINPMLQRGVNDTKSYLADQGLLSSTAGAGKLADVRSQYLAQAAQLAEQQGNTDRSFDEGVRQFGVNSAKDIFEMLTANALQRRALEGRDSATNRTPVQPTAFADIYKTRWAYPQPSTGPIGDPMIDESRGEVIAHVGGTGVKDLGLRNLEQQAADNAANRSIQKSYLKLAQQQAARDAANADRQDDPWALMTQAAALNRDLDPATPGDQAGLFPKDMLASFTGMYNVDVEAEAKAGNERAIAIYKILYPQTWQQRLYGGFKLGASGKDVWRNPNGSPSAIQNWLPEGAGNPLIERIKSMFTPNAGASTNSGYIAANRTAGR